MNVSRRRATLLERLTTLRSEKRLLEWRRDRGERITAKDKARISALHYEIVNHERTIADLPASYTPGAVIRAGRAEYR